MKPIVIILHICVCFALILIVLLQKGKGAGMGASFGGSSQTLFGSSGPSTFMQKITTIIAVVFMLTSLGLSFLFGKGVTTSVMEDLAQPQIPITETSDTPVRDGESQN